MYTVRFQFIHDRHGNSLLGEMQVPKTVPVKNHAEFVGIMLRRSGKYELVKDVILLKREPKFSLVECGGLPDNVDILAAGY